MKTRSTTFAAALLLSASAFGGIIPGSFRQIDCDGGGWFEQVIPHSSGRLYGRTDVGGMYRSDDHGDSWQFLTGDMPFYASYFVQGVAVAAGNPDVVYQATGVSYAASDPGRGIWKSTNGGSTWTQVLANVNFSGNDEQRWGGECLLIQPGNDNEIWAGSRGEGLWRSLNAGANWTNISPAVFDTPNVIISGITVHPSAPDTIWVAGDGGLWVSTNHGSTWTQKLSVSRIYRVVVKADGTAFAAGFNGNNNVLYRLTAGGTATDLYENVLDALPYPPFVGDHLATVQLLANGDLWVSDLFEFTLKSTDNGDSFTRMPMTLTGPLPGFVRPGTTTIEGGRNGLVQDPTNPSRLFLGGGYAPFRSDDGGQTWRYMTAGIGETVAWRASFHPTDPNRIWFPLADLGATTVSDAGASGASSGYISYHFPWPDDNVVFTHRLLVSANKVIAPGGEQASHHPRIYQTTDNGATWSKLAMAGLPDEYGREILEAVASSDNPDDFLVFTGGVIDGSAGGVYRTTNGGANFTRASGLPVGYDAGAEFYWNVSLERDANNAATRYLLLRNSGFWKSTDRGVTWTKPGVQPNNAFGRLRVDPTNGRIWVGTVIGLEYSDTGGASWTLLNGVFSRVTELDAHSGRLAVIGQMAGDTFDRIYYSGDNGATWGEITRPGNRFAKTEQVTIDPYRPGTVWISTGGRSIARFDPVTSQLIGAVSTKTHGTSGNYDVVLPLTGDPGVESRGTSGNHTFIFSFSANVVSGNASLTTQKGGSISGSPVFSGQTMTVNLTGVANEQVITVTLSGVTDNVGAVLPTSAISAGMLTGDTNADRTVNAGDALQTRTRSGQFGQATFRSDVNADGFINSGDALLVRSRSGTSLP